MDGMWFKRCPRCGNYMTKEDPRETCQCCACGWEEESLLFFCDAVSNYCHLIPRP
jgi:hypothetical protein